MIRTSWGQSTGDTARDEDFFVIRWIPFWGLVGTTCCSNGRSTRLWLTILVHNYVVVYGDFHKWGYPQSSSTSNDGMFHYKPTSYRGTPIYQNPHMVVSLGICGRTRGNICDLSLVKNGLLPGCVSGN